jgi:hypothetical protein
MIGNYLLLAARNLPRAGPFVAVSIVGLAIGLGASQRCARASGRCRRRGCSWLQRRRRS